jgi:hypothetical protein
VPVEGLQRRVAALLKPNRSRQSFVGDSSVFNATFPLRSEDMDVYAHLPIADVAARDAATLRGAGLMVDIDDRFYGFSVEALVSDGRDSTKVEWNEADRDRFFPVMEDDTFGWILHRADLAVQKLIAAASRRKPRDAVDVLLIDMLHAPIAVFAIAAPAKLGTVSPTRILDRVLEIANGHPIADYEALDLDRAAMPFPIGDVKLALADRLDAARRLIVEACPTAVPGRLYIDPGTGSIALPTAERMAALLPRDLSERGAFGAIGTAPVEAWTETQPDRSN